MRYHILLRERERDMKFIKKMGVFTAQFSECGARDYYNFPVGDKAREKRIKLASSCQGLWVSSMVLAIMDFQQFYHTLVLINC